MVMQVNVRDMRAAAEDAGCEFFAEMDTEMGLDGDDQFDDEAFVLQCAIDCLLQCGTTWKELRGKTIQRILDQYRVFLQEDLF